MGHSWGNSISKATVGAPMLEHNNNRWYLQQTDVGWIYGIWTMNIIMHTWDFIGPAYKIKTNGYVYKIKNQRCRPTYNITSIRWISTLHPCCYILSIVIVMILPPIHWSCTYIVVAQIHGGRSSSGLVSTMNMISAYHNCPMIENI